VRAIIFDYDSRLDKSQSFQSIADLASALANQLRAYFQTRPSTKPIAFFAHSLGGIVLKSALVQLQKSSNSLDHALLGRIRGAILFGVPNLGMEVSHFRTIVQANPNESLIDDLGRDSNFLRRLNESFAEISTTEHMRLFWAYETVESRTTTVSYIHTTILLPSVRLRRVLLVFKWDL
jgi:predicted alpha/beta hydrolase family esterase